MLVNTPAPDLSAAIFKIELITYEDLQESTVDDDVFGIVAADFSRLASGTAPLRCVEAQAPYAWSAVVAAEQLARDSMERFHSEIVAPIGKAHDDGAATFSDAVDAESAWGVFTNAHADAAEHMILTPAPTLKDVVRKIELGLESGRFGSHGHADIEYRCLVAIAEDVRRLAGDEE